MDLLLSYHDSKAGGGHLGIKRTYEAIKQKYYFKGMYNFIQNSALLRCPYAIEQKHLELVMGVKGHYELGYSF
jgi:hypothetical protein